MRHAPGQPADRLHPVRLAELLLGVPPVGHVGRDTGEADRLARPRGTTRPWFAIQRIRPSGSPIAELEVEPAAVGHRAAHRGLDERPVVRVHAARNWAYVGPLARAEPYSRRSASSQITPVVRGRPGPGAHPGRVQRLPELLLALPERAGRGGALVRHRGGEQ